VNDPSATAKPLVLVTKNLNSGTRILQTQYRDLRNRLHLVD